MLKSTTYLYFIIIVSFIASIQTVSALNYTISDCTELENIADMNGTYDLTGDIDCSASSGWHGGSGFMPIGNWGNRFNGTFDGHGFTITGLYIDRPATNQQALFGYAENANISNLTLTNADISAQGESGILIGASVNTIVSNIDITDSQITGTVSTAAISGKAAGVSGNFSAINLSNLNLTSPDNAGLVAGLAEDVSISNVIGSNLTLNLADYGGTLLGVIERTSISDVNLQDVNIVTYNTRANKIGGLVGIANFDSEISNISINNLDIAATDATTRSDDIAGIVGRLEHGSFVDDCHITNLIINGLDEIGGLAGSVLNGAMDPNNETIVSNSDIVNVTITGNEKIAGFIRRAREHTLIENCHIEDLTLVSNVDSAGGFVARLENAYSIKNCYVKNANLTFNGSFSGGFARSASSGGLLEKCYLENVTMTGAASSNVGGFMSLLENSTIEECFVKNLDLEFNNMDGSAGFIDRVAGNSIIRYSYVFDSDIKVYRGDNTGRASCFADLVENTALLEEVFCSARINGDFTDELVINAAGTVNKAFYDASQNIALGNNANAIALTVGQFNELMNFTGFNPAIWSNGSEHPILKRVQQEVTDSLNKILVSFNNIFPFLPQKTILSDVIIVSELDASDFNLEITDGAENVSLVDGRLLTRRPYNPGEKFTIELKATNSTNQTITSKHSFAVENHSFNEGSSKVSPAPEPKEPLKDEACLNELKNYLGYAAKQDITNSDLINLVLILQDVENSSSDINIQDVLDCKSIAADLEQINRDLASLAVNQKGRLNFKAYKKFTKSFKRALRTKETFSCQNLSYDFDHDCKLTSADFHHFKKYFKISINQRRKEKIIKKRLKRIAFRRRLNKYITIKDPTI
jgi:hypothetical protein